MDQIEITLDGKKLSVARGTTILEVAESQGIRIPTLCHDRRLDPYASCWVCLVKVEKAKGFVPSCSTRVTPGMVITATSPEFTRPGAWRSTFCCPTTTGTAKPPAPSPAPRTSTSRATSGWWPMARPPRRSSSSAATTPCPRSSGRICPRPCEQKCRRSLVEEPININGIKRFVADAEAAAGGMKPRAVPARTGKKVAVIGAGPAGLSAAWYLSEKGVEVTLIEAMEKAGGMLRYGIPDYRLPPAVLDRAISEMLSLGATLRTGVRLGKDVTFEKLRAENDAVVLAIGAWKGRSLRIPGEDHPAVLSGIDFLRDVNAGKPVTVGEIVAIIGGGNTALDAARCSLRRGASKVTMYYRRTREEMPASEAEIEEAMEEGIDIQYLAAPVSILAEGGSLKTLTLLRMASASLTHPARRRPVPVDGSEYAVPVDTIISAVGQYSDTKLLAAIPGLVDDKGNLKADLDTGRTEVPGVFAAGDLLTGTDIAIRAIAGGKHAARAALAYLEGGDLPQAQGVSQQEGRLQGAELRGFRRHPARAARQTAPSWPPGRARKGFMEIESTLAADAAGAEAARCLECGCLDVTECALKSHATEYDAMATRYLGEVARHPIDDSHPFISRDPSKCVLCGRCIRICLEVQGIGVFGYIYRGFASVVAPSFGIPFGEDATCISCGQCVSACPVGALTEKLPAKKNVPLPEKVVEGTCARCSVGCGMEYRWHGTLFTRVTERYDEPNNGKLCKKGKFGHDFLNDPRLAAVDLAAARETAQKLLAKAKKPVMTDLPVAVRGGDRHVHRSGGAQGHPRCRRQGWSPLTRGGRSLQPQSPQAAGMT